MFAHSGIPDTLQVLPWFLHVSLLDSCLSHFCTLLNKLDAGFGQIQLLKFALVGSEVSTERAGKDDKSSSSSLHELSGAVIYRQLDLIQVVL